MKLNYVVKENDKYITLKQILKQEFNISNRLLIKLKNSNQILVNGISRSINYNVHLNDIIKININFEETSENIVPTDINLNILYEDTCFLILNKPANIAIHPSCSHFDTSLSNGVKYYFNLIGLNKKIRPVNRLDKDTSRYRYFCKKRICSRMFN